MENSNYNIKFNELCEKLSLGEIINEPVQVKGGFLHLMYKVETNEGLYAIKVLNPQIMKRPPAMGHFILSEKVANIAYEKGIRALPAMIIQGKSIHELDGQYYLVFPWFKDKSTKPYKIDVKKCKVIGSLFAQIHNLDLSSLDHDEEIPAEFSIVEWNDFENAVGKEKPVWLEEFLSKKDALYEIERRTNDCLKKSAKDMVLGHRDLGPKNVLWDNNNEPMVIDWESTGLINPSAELFEFALYWADEGDKGYNENAFCALVDSYLINGGKIEYDLEDLLYCAFKGKIGWLEYCIKRSLGLDSGNDEEKLQGTNDVIPTIELIYKHLEAIPVIVDWFK